MWETLLALSCVAACGALHALVPRLVLGRGRRRLLQLCRQQKAVVVTFDDGPGRRLTPLVVERLGQAGVPATFFLLGCNVRGNEDLVELIRGAGNEVGTHGEDHVHHVWSWPWAGIVDTRRTWRRFHDLLGEDARRMSFRPPYGKMSLLSLLWVVWHRTTVVLWTHDSYDARAGLDKSPAQLVDELRRDGGGVVLLHDFDRSVAGDGDQVLQKLDAVLALRDEGFRFITVGELVA